MRAITALLLALAAPAAAQTAGTLLVGNKGDDTLSLVDLATAREVRRMPTGRMPHEISLSPDGRRAAVVAYGGRTIDFFALPAGTRTGSVDLGANARPHGLLWLSGDRLLATAEGRDALMLVGLSVPEPTVAEIATGAKGSHMVAASPDHAHAYVANMRSGTVGVFDLAARRKVRDLPAGREPEGLAVTPDGRRLWVADRLGHSVRVFDTATLTHLADLPTGETPIRVAVSPDGARVVTSNFGAGTLSEFDARTLKPLRTIPVGDAAAQQVTILFARDGRRLYVAETGANKVVELAWPDGRVLRRLPAGENGDGLGLSPILPR